MFTIKHMNVFKMYWEWLNVVNEIDKFQQTNNSIKMHQMFFKNAKIWRKEKRNGT